MNGPLSMIIPNVSSLIRLGGWESYLRRRRYHHRHHPARLAENCKRAA